MKMNTVQWKTIPFENLYEVSTTGLVRNKKTGNIKSQRLDKYGYMRVTLYPSSKTYTIHRLVMLTFKPNEKDENINHIDGNKENNNIDNLEWCTISENCKHRSTVLYPDIVNGERNPMAKITEETAKQIKYGNYSGLNNREIGDIFGVSSEVVRRIRSNERWKHT